MFPSWYEYSSTFKVDEQTFYAIFDSCLYVYDPTVIPIGYDSSYFVKNLQDVVYQDLATCITTVTGGTLAQDAWTEIVAYFDTTCQETFYDYDPTELLECTEEVLEETDMTMIEC